MAQTPQQRTEELIRVSYAALKHLEDHLKLNDNPFEMFRVLYGMLACYAVQYATGDNILLVIEKSHEAARVLATFIQTSMPARSEPMTTDEIVAALRDAGVDEEMIKSVRKLAEGRP